MGRHLWTARRDDADRFLGERCRGQAHSTVSGKAFGVSVFFEYLELRHHAEIHALTGDLVQCPIDEMNRPRDGWKLNIRIPPSDAEIDRLFDGWRDHVATARKFLPAARNYTAAKLWSQVGLRIGESTRLDMADLKWELGLLGKVHVRFGKGSRRRGPKQRVVPLINGARDQAVWFVEEIRGQFDDSWDQPGAPFLVSERRAADGSCGRVSAETLRAALARAVERHLSSWRGLPSTGGAGNVGATAGWLRPAGGAVDRSGCRVGAGVVIRAWCRCLSARARAGRVSPGVR